MATCENTQTQQPHDVTTSRGPAAPGSGRAGIPAQREPDRDAPPGRASVGASSTNGTDGTRRADRRVAHMIGNAHIDPVWLWRWQEGRAEVRATFTSALERLDEYPQFVFTQNQVVFLHWVADTDPAMFARIRGHVATGRWQLAGGWWVEPDTNTPLGESLVRQALLGQRFLVESFGVRTDVALCQDSFGHPASLPQLLAGAGLDHFVFLRPGPHELPLPAGAFRWTGPDGSSVLASRIPNEYATGRSDIADHLDKALAQSHPSEDALVFFGVGNHGGGPTRANLDTIGRLSRFSGVPRAECSTIGQYFARVVAATDDRPGVVGDLHRHAVGCYSAHADMKRWMRRAERALVTAERWAVAAAGVADLRYPADDLRRAWRATLFNQFHDTLAGTAVPEAYVDARDQLGLAAASADEVVDRSLQAIAARVAVPFVEDTQTFLLFNPTAARRATTAVIDYDGGPGGPLRAQDVSTGRFLPTQAVAASATTSGWRRRLLVPVDLPGTGYRAVRLVPDPAGAGMPPPARDLRPGEQPVLDNGRVRLALDPATGRPAALHRAGQQNLLADGAHAVAVHDPSDTWGHRVRAFDGASHEFQVTSIRVVEGGPVRQALRVESATAADRLVEVYRLGAGSEHVDVEVTLHWASPHTVCKLRYPTRLAAPATRWECAYGSTDRLADGAEYPLHGWVTVAGRAGRDGRAAPDALTVLVDGLASADAARTGPGVSIGLTAARSPLYAWHDPCPAQAATDPRHLDIGTHHFTVRLLPHRADPGRPVAAPVLAAATDLHDPVQVMREGAHPGRLPVSGSFCQLLSGTAAVTAMKAPEDARPATVLRVAETSGAPTDAVLRLGGRTLRITLGAHQVRTLRVPHDPRQAAQDVDLCEWADGERPPVQTFPETGHQR